MRKMKENACNNKNQKKNPGFLLSAVSSNSGKTAAACGLMSAFKQEGKRVCACKCGPDYIDPMFHREVLGVDSKNLDLFFSEEDILKEGYLKHTKFNNSFHRSYKCHCCTSRINHKDHWQS